MACRGGRWPRRTHRPLRLRIRIDHLAENEVDHRPQLRRALALEILKAVDVHESLSNQFACDESSGLNLSITRHWSPLDAQRIARIAVGTQPLQYNSIFRHVNGLGLDEGEIAFANVAWC